MNPFPEAVPKTDYAQLGKRLVASKHFRWRPGMLVSNGARIVAVNDDTPLRFAGFYPDLSDAATKGCVLQLVREAWDDSEAHFAIGAAGWVLMSGESRVADVVYPSPPSNNEAEAMVNAMEAAP
jgi:hypothetical protein